MHSQAKTSSYKTPGTSWNEEGVGPKLETRKATCNTQTRQIRNAAWVSQGRAGLRRRRPNHIN